VYFFKDLPTDKLELAFNNDLVLLVVKREINTDTSKSTLVKTGVLIDPAILGE
jgi:hypothetical protein